MDTPPIPPQQTGYYRPPTNSPMSPYRPPGVYFDAISGSITLLQRDLGVWVGATLFYIVASIPLTIVSMIVQGHGQLIYMGPFDWGTWLQGEAISQMNGFITTTIFAGMIHMGVKSAKGEPISFKDLFYGISQIGSFGLAMILLGIVIGLGCLALVIPGIFLGGAFALAIPIMAEQKVGAVEGMRRSFEALKPHAWAMFGLMLVTSIVAGLGYIACGIGILFTLPILPIVLGMHYTYFFPDQAVPMPTQYQFLEPPGR